MRTKKIAIKPYLETIAAYCNPLTNTQLKQVIFTLAKDIPTAQRADFLDKIKTSLPDSDSIKIRKIAPIEIMLEDIEALKEGIEERIEACEAFIKAHKHNGWRWIEEHFNDEGWSGASLDRPAP